MYKCKYLILFIVVFLSLGCSKREEKGGSSASNIKLSDINANLSGKSLFITIGDSSSSSSRSSRNSSNKSSTTSLIVSDNLSNFNYGIISNYNLNVEKVVTDPTNSFAYILLKYTGGHSDLESDKNIRSLNCTIFKVNLSNNELNCLYNGLIIFDVDTHEKTTRNAYTKDYFQFSDNGKIFFKGYSSELPLKTELECKNSCLYNYNINTSSISRINDHNQHEVSRFLALSDGGVVYTGWIYENGNWTQRHTEIILIDSQGNKHELSSMGGNGFHHDINSGEFNSIIYGSDHIEPGSSIEVVRMINGNLRKTYLTNQESTTLAVIKGDDGYFYAHGDKGLRRILPYSQDLIIDLSSYLNGNQNCDASMNCYVWYKVVNGIVVYYISNYDINGKPTSIIAKNISDNKTVNILQPDNECKNNCYKINYAEDDSTAAWKPKWFTLDNTIYISMTNLNTNKNEILNIDLTNLNFNQGSNQYSTLNKMKEFSDFKKTKFVSGLKNINSNSSNVSAVIKHESNDNKSVRIEFSNIMNFSDVESKLEIVDNSSNNQIFFMSIWNDKTLHLLPDLDNGTVFNYKENPLTSGRTYKVTLLGSAKDADGNTLGSDVVKYITP